MPNYDYHCVDCSHVMETFQKITDAPLTVCPSCHKSTLKRGPGGGIGLLFKGSGFYITDYDSNRKSNDDTTSSCCPCGKNSCQ